MEKLIYVLLKRLIKVILKSGLYKTTFFKLYYVFFTQLFINKSFLFKELLFNDPINNLRNRLFHFFVFVLTLSFSCKILPNFLMFWEYKFDLYLTGLCGIPIDRFINDLWFYDRLIHRLDYSYVYHTFDNMTFTIDDFVDFFSRRTLIIETLTNDNYLKKVPTYGNYLSKEELAQLKLQQKVKLQELNQLRLNEVKLENAKYDFMYFCLAIFLGVTCYKALSISIFHP